MADGTPTLSQELAKWVADLRMQWSGKIEQPLRGPIIFLYTFVGALTLFSSLVFVRFINALLPLVTPDPGSVLGVFGSELIGKIVLVFFALTPSFGIAWLVSWPNRAYSPARLFLGGLTFSALVCWVIFRVMAAASKGTAS